MQAAKAGKLNSVGVKAITPEQMELSRLRAEVSRLRMECEILKKSDGVLRERGTVRYAWIDTQRTQYPLPAMCSVLSVSQSGYRAWTHGGTPPRTRLTDVQWLALIQAIHAELKGAYGSPRMRTALRGRGFSAGKARVERLMREHRIYARHKRRYNATTDSRHTWPVAKNLLDRQCTPAAPNQAWTADSTSLWTDEGWRYLAIVLDLFNREVVGWSIQSRMTADIVAAALTLAWFRRRPARGLMHHSDRGSQYASGVFQDQLKEYGMICSMSRKGNCWDHAPTESGCNGFKNERVHGLRDATRAAMTAASVEYIEVFDNRTRRHSTLDYQPPMQFLEDWRLAQHEDNLVA